MAAKLFAVLIADVVASTYQHGFRKRLGNTLALASRQHLHKKLIRLPYAVTAGDEFQTICISLPVVSQLIFDLRILLQPLSLRIGVGIGHIEDRIQPPVNRLGGEAFQFARKAIDAAKSGGPFKFDSLTCFASPDAAFDETVNLLYGLNDTLLAGVTAKQWKTIATFSRTPELAKTSRHMKLDASTISRNLKRAYYWQLTAAAQALESFIERTFR